MPKYGCYNFIRNGGEIYQMKVGSKTTPDLKTEKRKISLENTNKLLGLNLNEKQIKNLLEKNGA